MNFWLLFCLAAFVVHLYFYLIYSLAIIKKRNDYTDIAWGTGFILVALLSLIISGNLTWRFLLITFLVISWGARLGIHIYLRNKNKKEDFRYLKWRQEWGNWWQLRSYLQVFFLQAWILLIIAIPIMWVAAFSYNTLGLLDLLGFIFWLVGFYFEAVGDYQLTKFKQKKSNQGKIMKSGLWRYTRHPNYFGESLMWWGIFFISLGVGRGFATIISPLLITYLLTQVSGIPMLEKKYEGNKEFERYKKETSVFFPLPVRQTS